MSEQEIQVISERNDVLSLLDKEDKHSVVWWNPVTDCIVKGSKIIGGKEHPSDHVIVDLKKRFEAKKLYNAKKISFDKFSDAGYSQEFRDSGHHFNAMLKKSRESNKNLLNAAVIKPEHFKALQTASINELIITIQNNTHNLLQTVTQITSDKLNEKTILEIGNSQKVVTRNIGEEGQPTEIQPYKWREYSIGLQLNGTKIVYGGSLAMTAFDIDVRSPFVKIMENGIILDKHLMIAEILNSTAISDMPQSDDWDAIDANGRPTARPYKSIGAQKTIINKLNRGPANWIASQLGPYEVYNESSDLLGQVATGPITQSSYEDSNFIAGNVPRLPGFRWAVDDWINADSLLIYASKAIYFNQGPRRSSNIFNSISGNFGVINLEYYKAKLMFPDMIKRFTSLTS